MTLRKTPHVAAPWPYALMDASNIPAAIALAAAVVLAADQGGSDPNTWYPAALLTVALVAVVAVARGRGGARLRGTPTVPLCALVAYTAWCFASLLWSGVGGDAWDGANRTLLYLATFALFATAPPSRALQPWFFGAYGVAVASVGVATFVGATTSREPLAGFIGARLADPIGYPNGDFALFMIAVWCVVPIAAARTMPGAARIVALAAAVAAAELAFLTGSRGGSVAIVISILAYLLVARDRLRAGAVLGVVAVAVAVAAPSLLHVYETGSYGGDLEATFDRARTAFLGTIAAAAATAGAGLAIGRAVRGRPATPAIMRAVRLALVAAAVVAAVSAVAVGAANEGRITHRVQSAWHQFTAPPPPADQLDPGSSHFTSDLGGAARYDIWKVAWREFRRHPLVGVGVDNFAVDYVRERQSSEEPSYPHSLILRLPSQTGIVGTALFALFLGSVAVGLRRARRPSSEVPVLAASVVFVYWLVHGAFDSLWEIPAVSMPVFAILGATLASAAPASARRASMLRLIAATTCLAGAVSLALPWLAAREERVALASWRTDPPRAYEALSRARSLNPLTDKPDLLAGAISARRHDYGRTETSFERVLERNPSSWYAYVELAALEALQGRAAAARRHLAAATRLNPREPAITDVQRGLRSRRPVRLSELDELFLRRFKARTRRGDIASH